MQSRYNKGGACFDTNWRFIESHPGVHGGRPCIAGTSVSIRRIAVYYKAGFVPEEIAGKFGHLSLAQVHAALRII